MYWSLTDCHGFLCSCYWDTVITTTSYFVVNSPTDLCPYQKGQLAITVLSFLGSAHLPAEGFPTHPCPHHWWLHHRIADFSFHWVELISPPFRELGSSRVSSFMFIPSNPTSLSPLKCGSNPQQHTLHQAEGPSSLTVLHCISPVFNC